MPCVNLVELAVMKPCLRILALVGLCTACGSSTTGSGTSTGTVAGQSLTVADAIFNTVVVPENTANVNVLAIVLSSFSGVCADLSDTNPPSGDVLILAVGSESAITTGTFSIVDTSTTTASPGGTYGFALFGAATASTSDNAVSGSITVSSLSESSAGGSYALTFPDGELSGSFAAAQCGALNESALGG
jgi:hypothetical protein